MGEAAAGSVIMEGAALALKNRNLIKRTVSSVSQWFKGARKEILILGAGGTGKSTLGRILSGNYDFLLDAPRLYKESIGVETVSFKKDKKVEIVIPPGQEHRRQATWTDYYRDIEGGKFRGVILMSAYGYHSLSLNVTLHRLFDPTREDRFLEDYILDRQKEELSVLKELAPHIEMNRHPMWFMNVVTKEDLWWPHKDVVHRHYFEGQFGKEIDKLAAKKDAKLFRHETVKTSLIISQFLASSEVLKQNTAGYDHKRQVQSLHDLYHAADALRKWELK